MTSVHKKHKKNPFVFITEMQETESERGGQWKLLSNPLLVESFLLLIRRNGVRLVKHLEPPPLLASSQTHPCPLPSSLQSDPSPPISSYLRPVPPHITCLVVHRFLFLIGQDRVRLAERLEFFGCFHFVGLGSMDAVWVDFQR